MIQLKEANVGNILKTKYGHLIVVVGRKGDNTLFVPIEKLMFQKNMNVDVITLEQLIDNFNLDKALEGIEVKTVKRGKK